MSTERKQDAVAQRLLKKQLPAGGCGKPGHVTSTPDPSEGDAATLYCVTCEEGARLMRDIAKCIDPNDASKTILVRRGPCIAFDEHGNEVAWIVEGQPQYVITGLLAALDKAIPESGERLKLLQFLSWIKKHKLRLPTAIEEAHRMVTEYLKDEREQADRRIMRKRRAAAK